MFFRERLAVFHKHKTAADNSRIGEFFSVSLAKACKFIGLRLDHCYQCQGYQNEPYWCHGFVLSTSFQLSAASFQPVLCLRQILAYYLA